MARIAGPGGLGPVKTCDHCGHRLHLGDNCRAARADALPGARCPCALFPDGTADPKALERLHALHRKETAR
jgi:hypothetical protein